MIGWRKEACTGNIKLVWWKCVFMVKKQERQGHHIIQSLYWAIFSFFCLPRSEKVYDNFQLPAQRQTHSVLGAFVHAGTISLFFNSYTFSGDRGSFTSVHELKFMRTQTAPQIQRPSWMTSKYHRSSTPISTLPIPDSRSSGCKVCRFES